MFSTHPKVYLVARPQINAEGMRAYLDAVDGAEWYERIANANELSHGEALVEFMGRNCYRSWKPGLNPNVTKVREDSFEYLGNILESGHGSVLEHAQYSFVFHNVSRVFTHELVRHRAGVAISQESLRYVRLTDIGFRIPPILAEGPDLVMAGGDGEADTIPMRDAIVSIVETLEDFQKQAAHAFGLDDEGVPFHYKKEVTSALRRLAPIGLSTTIGWSANVRTLRHVIEMRTALGAEEEIRTVFQAVAAIMREECPALSQDMFWNENGEVLFDNVKV